LPAAAGIPEITPLLLIVIPGGKVEGSAEKV
jgi:hypothetical protein